MTPKQVVTLAQERVIEFVDCRFMDFPGLWQHITVPVSELSEDSFELGFGFDGSSVRGWQALNESDMLLMPVAETAHIDPFFDRPTLGLICDVKDPITRKHYSRDPRSIARRAADFLRDSGIADTAMFGPEIEFFVFDHASYDQDIRGGWYRVDSGEGVWNRGNPHPANLGYQVRQREGYFPAPPTDSLHNLRSEMVALLREMGIAVEGHHHEVATGGQCEIDLRHGELLKLADACMLTKYIVRGVANRHGKAATFMPKPLFGDNGSGMHTHFSLWKDGENLFSGNRYAGLSQTALFAIGGLLRHAPSLLAFTNPTTNSFKRLVPGFEAPVHFVYSSRNRSAAIRIPVYQDNPRNPQTKRLEFRCPDPSCNPYLAFAAIVMAAIDGIRHRIDPGDPMDKDLSNLEPEELSTLRAAPHDLTESLSALEADHAFLTEGGVFSEEVVRYWIKYKRDQEVGALRARPHPYEFCMYFDV